METYIYKSEKPFYYGDVMFAENGDTIDISGNRVTNISNGNYVTDIAIGDLARLMKSFEDCDLDELDEPEVSNNNVNHPDYYNNNPSGIECIDVIRHYPFNVGCAIKYLWRAGLKKDASLSDKEKEIEDLKKAIWYIEDRIKQLSI